ncbi:MAG: hypothetical protein JO051_10615 [Acidobacteriaceae bacterium]|nr:hypothetical protein [Acidobacteriaceae bacterium]
MRLFTSTDSSRSTFTVKPGVQIMATYGPQQEACVLTVTGAVSEQELLKVFDSVAPPKSRGVKKSDMIECVGACQRNISYEGVTFTTGVVGKAQTSEPAAIIVFEAPQCKKAAEGAKKIVLNTPGRD